MKQDCGFTAFEVQTQRKRMTPMTDESGKTRKAKPGSGQRARAGKGRLRYSHFLQESRETRQRDGRGISEAPKPLAARFLSGGA